MEKVVYLLGAGFSPPLGIPVMRNFLTKSRDLYYSDQVKFAHFQEIFSTINELSVIKNFYSSDLFNIEEILSILEMREYLEGEELKANFLKYLADVINHYTPELRPYGRKLPTNWRDALFTSYQDPTWRGYGHFISTICNLIFRESPGGYTGEYKQIYCQHDANPDVSYSIVTLNYDCVPESVLRFINGHFNCETDVSLRIAKLHGSVDSGVIVPPTWNKGANRKITVEWKRAYDYLTEANHLRIIGYSLPVADAYVKYLLKSAVTKAPHLKAIDVISLDQDGTVKNRYDEFMSFTYYRFVNKDVSEYLGQVSFSGIERTAVRFDKLERAHMSCFD